MSIKYYDNLATLKSMFGEQWKDQTLDAVLRHFEGHMENTIEAILNHGDGNPESLIAKLNRSGSSGADTDYDEQLARQLAAEENQQWSMTASRRKQAPGRANRI